MPRTIIVANQKGGVGKTTTVVNLAASLAHLGYRTIIIDLDPQGALTVSCGIDPYKVKPSIHDVLLNQPASLVSTLHQVSTNLYISPANAELVSAEYKLIKEKDRISRLKKAIANASQKVDFYILDTPPSLGLLTVNGLVAADELLIPVATDYLAMRGVRALLESVWLIHERANPRLQLLSLVPTLYRPESPHADTVVTEMRKVFKHKVSNTCIPIDPAAAAAPAVRKSILEYAPDSTSAKAYLKLAQEVLNA